MKIGVNLKIDVKKIDKARLFRGQKGTYLDAQCFIELEEFDQYGNSGMITQCVSQQERQQGIKGEILGNCKVFWNDSQPMPQQQAQQPQYQPPQQPPSFQPVDTPQDDIPF